MTSRAGVSSGAMNVLISQAERRYPALALRVLNTLIALEFSIGSVFRDRKLRAGRNAGDDLDLEIEAGEPIDADCGPVRVRRLAENLLLDGHDGWELVFGVRVERRHIHDVVERAAGRAQRGLEIFEGQLDLLFKIRFWRSIGAAADLPGHEQEVAGSNGSRVAMLLVESMSVWGEDCLALGHFHLSQLSGGRIR